MSLIDTLGQVGQKQRVRLTLEDGTKLEGRVNQAVFDPDDRLRLELVSDDTDGFERLQVRARFADGSWLPPLVRGYVQGGEEWTDLGTVADVTPLDTYGTPESWDMDAQEETGTDG